MLIEFSVENFKSIKDEVTFSMLASGDSDKPENIFNTDIQSLKEANFLKSAVIFGPNASGKSNIIEAFYFLRKLVFISHLFQADDKIPVMPYKFDKNYTLKPSKFNIIFVSEDTKFSYSVSCDENRILEESLYYWKTTQPIMVFERTPDKSKINTSELKQKEKLKQEIYLEETPDNTLFLSQATRLKHPIPIITKAYKWFDNYLKIKRNPALRSDFTTEKCLKDNVFKEKILRNLAHADFGIKDFNVLKETVPFENVPNEVQEFIVKKMSEKNIDHNELKDFELESIDIKTFHLGRDTNGNSIKVELNIDEESTGTIQYYELMGPILNILENGFVFVIDELDSSLHPLLVERMVKLFHSPVANKKNAQLIFTTHNVQLLEANLFRRDQIWFTEKTKELESTDLFSLGDINGVRKDLNLRKGYLQGRFGAIPFISKGDLSCQD